MSAGSAIWKCSIRQRRSLPYLSRQLLVGGDDLRVGGIADGVDRDLEPVACRLVGLGAKLCILQELQPARVRLVGVGLLQPGAARAERAVGVELDPAHPQPVAEQPRRRTVRHDCTHVLHAVGVAHDPDVQPAGLRPRGCIAAQSAADVPMSAAAVMPTESKLLLRLGQGLRRAVRGSRWRDLAIRPDPSRHRRTSRSVAIRVALDLAADRVLGRRRDAGGLASPRCWRPTHGRRRARARPAGRTRRRRDRRRSGSACRPTSSWFQPRPEDPRIVRPAPLHRRSAAAAGRRPSLCRRGRAEAPQAQPHHMAMRVDQAGQQRPSARRRRACAGERRHRRACAMVCTHLAVVADQQAREALQLAVGADLDAVDVVDQRVGESGRRRGARRRARAAVLCMARGIALFASARKG